MSWHQIEIINDTQGKPSIITHNECHKILQNLKIKNIELSLSHTKHHGVAVVILQQSDG